MKYWRVQQITTVVLTHVYQAETKVDAEARMRHGYVKGTSLVDLLEDDSESEFEVVEVTPCTTPGCKVCHGERWHDA